MDAIILPLALVFLIPMVISIGWAGFLLWAMLGYFAWRILWNLFGVEELVVTTPALTITSRLLFLHNVRRCESDNIDWIAYHAHAYRSPSGIGILLKDRVMPFGIGFDLQPLDAEAILQAIKANAPWLGPRVRGTSETSFYKLS